MTNPSIPVVVATQRINGTVLPGTIFVPATEQDHSDLVALGAVREPTDAEQRLHEKISGNAAPAGARRGGRKSKADADAEAAAAAEAEAAAAAEAEAAAAAEAEAAAAAEAEAAAAAEAEAAAAAEAQADETVEDDETVEGEGDDNATDAIG